MKKLTTVALVLILSSCNYFKVKVDEPECVQGSMNGKCAIEKDATLPTSDTQTETVKEEVQQK